MGPTKVTTEPASHSAAPVALIFAPKEMVDPKSKITPQWVFLFKSSHFTKPPTKYIKTPVNAIVPRPMVSLKNMYPKKTNKNINTATVFLPVSSADFVTWITSFRTPLSNWLYSGGKLFIKTHETMGICINTKG